MLLNRRFALLLTLAVASPVVFAADNGKSESKRPKDATSVFAGTPLFWKTDWVMDFYATQITRYYNLNKEQEDYTRKLLSQRVKAFLENHERDVRGLIAEYFEYQISQELPDAKTAQDFAKRAAPLLKDIRKEIVEGNMRWREILDDEQKAKHDNDLKQMTMFFDGLEQGLDRWKQGRVQPTDVPGRLVPAGPGLAGNKIEDSWDYWVKRFIQLYKLDDGQKQTAASVLRELKDEAARYREANKERFTQLEADQKAITQRAPKFDPDELAKYQDETAKVFKRRADLERPINALFDQLKSRVEAVPTVDQRKNRQAEVDRLKAITRFVAGSRPAATSRPAIVSSRPATATNVAETATTTNIAEGK